MTNPIDIDAQFERIKSIERALANGAHYADDPECHPCYSTLVAARQLIEKECRAMATELEALRASWGRMVDVKAERSAFETWWRMWCPDQDMPPATSHIFDAWLARARAALQPAEDCGVVA